MEPPKGKDEPLSLTDLDAKVKNIMASFVDINVAAATAYTWSSNNPASGQLPYLPINKDDNSISLYDGFFQVSRHREDEDFGFTFNMDIGQTAQYAGADWDGSGATEGDFIEVREFFGTYKTPLAGIKLKAGKFVSLLGYEVLLTNTAYNPTATLGYLFMNVPYTNVGLMANVPLGEIAWMDVGVVNGWDNVVDNNNAKSVMIGVGAAPLEGFTTYLAGIIGNEVCGQNSTKCTGLPAAGAGSKRAAVTWNMGYTLPEDLGTGLGLALDTLYANESDVLPNSLGQEFADNAQWYGAAGYILWSAPWEEVDGLSLNLRATWFGDPDGYRNPTGTTNPDAAGAQTLWEVSPTIGYAFNDHILARLEYRHDASNKPTFETKTAGPRSPTP
jgi:hypothetical protein